MKCACVWLGRCVGADVDKRFVLAVCLCYSGVGGEGLGPGSGRVG